MRVLCFALYCMAGAFSSGLSAATSAEPAELVRAALQDFLDQPSYTWGVANTRGMPEENGEDIELAMDGQHEKGGYTFINFRRGPHIPPDAMPVRKGWPGFMDREGAASSRWVFWTPEGWQSLRELPLAPGHGPRPRPRSSSSGPGKSITLSSPSIGLSVSSRELVVRRPDHEIAIVLANLDEVSLERPDHFTATLTSAGATQLLSRPGRAMVLSSAVIVRNATARVSLRVRDGQLVSYELACDGIMAVLGRRVPRSFVLIRNLRDLGTTEIKVPPEVRLMLGDKTSGTETDGP
jgi:hypothetical protein